MEIMTNEEQQAVLQDAVDTYGMDNQMKVLQEECGELIVAVSHYQRGRVNAFDNIVEELADVTIMIKQMLYALDADVPFEFYCEKKINRLKERLAEHKAIG